MVVETESGRRYRDKKGIADYLGISERLVHSLIAAGELKCIRVGNRRILVDVEDADRYMSAHKSA